MLAASAFAAGYFCFPSGPLPIKVLFLTSSFHALLSHLTTPFPLFLSGNVEGDDVVDSKILPYCSIDKKEKKTVGELEQEFLQALQVR